MILDEGIIEFCSMFKGTAFPSKPKHDNAPALVQPLRMALSWTRSDSWDEHLIKYNILTVRSS
jgi:hypothetical protein